MWPVYQNLLVICHLLVLHVLIFIALFCPFYNGFIFFPFSFHEQILSNSKTFLNDCRHNITALFYSFYNYLFWNLTKHLSVGKNAILRHLRFLQSKNYIYTKSHELKNELWIVFLTEYFTLLSLHLLLILLLKPPIIWILCVCQDWFLNTGALWPNCKRYWRIIFFFWHEFSMSKRSSVLIFALYIRWKSLSKYLWRRKLQRYAFFFFLLWRQFLALLIKMKIKQCLLHFRFKNSCMCSL